MIGTQKTAGLRSKLWAEGKTVLFLFIYLALLRARLSITAGSSWPNIKSPTSNMATP